MQPDLVIVFIIIVGGLFLFVSGTIPIDQTSIIIMVSLMVTGVLTPEEGVAGFSNTATLTVLALLIVSEALKNTGVVDELGDQLLKFTGNRLWTTVLFVMVLAAICSAFINTTAVVAVFIPVMFKISRQSNIKVALLLIPLSFAGMVGGSSTMIGTSTNLLINSVAQANGQASFKIFDLTLFGAILFAALVAYILIVGIKFLYKKPENINVFDRELEAKNYLTELLVTPESKLIGENFASLKLYDKTEYKLQRLIRNETVIQPVGEMIIREGDIITVKTNIHEIININNNPNLQILTNPENRFIEEGTEHNRVLYESLIVPNSNLIGRKIKNIEFNRFYDAFPLAVRRGALLKSQKLMDHEIQVGDILLMDGKNQKETEQSKHDWIIIQQISRERIEKQILSRKKILTSIGILLMIILLAVNNILPILVSAWLGVVLMFLTGCISVKKAYENVEWKVVFLLAGIIPLGTALSKTGGAQYLAEMILNLTEGASPRLVISVLFLITTLLTGVISNQATAVLLVPIAIQIATSIGISAEPLLVAILFGANTSFITPVGYQTNAMIFGPGNYTFSDFLKVGGGLSLIFWLLATWLIPWLYL
ncbi:MAG: SLC13 family permease [Fulvivirga sp.]